LEPKKRVVTKTVWSSHYVSKLCELNFNHCQQSSVKPKMIQTGEFVYLVNELITAMMTALGIAKK